MTLKITRLLLFIAFTFICHVHYGQKVLSFESFDYPNGPLDGKSSGSGWQGTWVASDGAVNDYLVSNTDPMSYSSLYVSSSKLTGNTTNGKIVGRYLNTSTSGPYATYLDATGSVKLKSGLHLTFLLKMSDVNKNIYVGVSNGLESANVNNGASVGYYGIKSTSNGKKYWTLKINNSYYLSTIEIQLNTPVFFTLLHYTSGTTFVSINPIVQNTDHPGNWNINTNDNMGTGFKSVFFYSEGGEVDEIRIANSYGAAAVFDPNTNLQGVNNLPGSGTPGSAGTSTDNQWRLDGNTGLAASQFIGTTDAQDFKIRTNNAERVTVTKDGKVGIGTSTPSEALEIKGQSPNIKLVNGLGGIGGGIDFYSQSFGRKNARIATQNPIDNQPTDEDWAGDLTFYTGSSGEDVFDENMRITYDGRVGIGTASPSERLEVVGSIKANGIKIGTGPLITNLTPSQWITNGSNISFSNGDVGIGTISPSEKLEVGGKTKTQTIQITSGAGNDKILVSDANGNATWQNMIWNSLIQDNCFHATYPYQSTLYQLADEADCIAAGGIHSGTYCSLCLETIKYSDGAANWFTKLSQNIDGLNPNDASDNCDYQIACPDYRIAITKVESQIVNLANQANPLVGIGTATPTERLEVNGNIKLSDKIMFGDEESKRLFYVDGSIDQYNGFNISLGHNNDDALKSLNIGEFDTENGQNRFLSGTSISQDGRIISKELQIGNIKITGTSNVNYIQFPDNTKQYTASENYWTKSGNNISYGSGNVNLTGSNREILFSDNGQIRSLDNNHRILFRRSENKMELREAGDIVFSPGATAGNETAKIIMRADGALVVKKRIDAPEFRACLNAGSGDCPPDYVFDSDYKLMGLDTLKSYLAKNKHLPEVPSAKEMLSNGLDMKAMNMTLLKKVEELTLYILKQEERISKLEKDK